MGSQQGAGGCVGGKEAVRGAIYILEAICMGQTNIQALNSPIGPLPVLFIESVLDFVGSSLVSTIRLMTETAYFYISYFSKKNVSTVFSLLSQKKN